MDISHPTKLIYRITVILLACLTLKPLDLHPEPSTNTTNARHAMQISTLRFAAGVIRAGNLRPVLSIS